MANQLVTKKSLMLSRASAAWKFLNGTINVYKPAGMLTRTLINAIKINLCKGECILNGKIMFFLRI